MGGMTGVARNKLEVRKKAMKQDKTEQHVIASTRLLVICAALTFFVGSIVRANPARDNAASSAMFRTKCAMCHGRDGGGSEVGKSMNVPDLRTPAVQKLPDAQLLRIISNGKGGMPSFKNSLREDQIHSMVSYIRSFYQTK
jgi:cytochrome c6